MRIVLVGGGSIGHMAPAIAVWRAVQQYHPDAQARLICSERAEDLAFAAQERMEAIGIPTPRLSPSLPLRWHRASRQVHELFDNFSPDVVFCKGGAVSVLPALIAKRRGIPVVLHESDALAGRASVFLSRSATVTCTGFTQAGGLRGDRIVHTGNPVRPEIARGKREEGLRMTGLSGARPILLVCGGSQGAEALNTAVIEHVRNMLSLCDIVHLTGPGKSAAPAQEGYWSTSFARSELPHLYAIADLAISRSGAGAISELSANGIPAILVPLRGVARDHQLVNARAAAESGACILLEQETLRTTLLPTLQQLFGEAQTLQRMSSAMQTLFAPEAAMRIAEIVVREVRK